MRKYFTLAYLLLLSSLLWTTPARSQWPTNYTASLQVNSGNAQAYSPQIVSDNAGGAIFVWEQELGNYQHAYLYSQRIDQDGNHLWNDNSAIADSVSTFGGYSTISDGAGGTIICWSRDDSGDDNIYMQHINGDGQELLPHGGQIICNAAGNQFSPKIVQDNNNGYIIAWKDLRGADARIYAQRITAAGNPLWLVNGVPVVTGLDELYRVDMVADNANGAILIWRQFDTDNGYEVVLQRINNNGNMMWDPNGVQMGSVYSSIISDNENGAIVAWNKSNDSNVDGFYKIYLERFDGIDGSTVWTMPATPDSNDGQYIPMLINDRIGGGIVAWREHNHLYAQRVTANGERLWASRGVEVCNMVYPWIWDMVPSGSGGVTLLFGRDYEDPYYNNHRTIFAQKLNPGGERKWQESGIQLAPDSWHSDISAVSTPGGKIITGWVSVVVNQEENIQTQMLDQYGYLGYGNPTLGVVQDVPDDQGGHVSVTWNASSHDTPDDSRVTNYSIWRGLSHAPATKQLTAQNNASGSRYRRQVTSSDTIYWEWLANQPAHQLNAYSYTANTLADSTAGDSAALQFMVSAEVNSSGEQAMWDSNVKSGYSVDNLSPAPPAQLTAQLDNETVRLQWKSNTEEDLGEYAIYRSTQSGFDPDTASVYQTTTDTTFQDANLGTSSELHYVVEALDIHGNHSDASNRASVTVTGTQNEAGTLPQHFALQQNYPNPFNPTTTIRYALPRKSLVKLTVYNARGELVRTVVQLTQQAGFHHVEFDASDLASGMYLYRITAGNYTQVKKMILMK